jgi:hypothetical protein
LSETLLVVRRSLERIEQSTINNQLKTRMNIENQNAYMLLYRSDEWYKKLSHQELHSLMDQNKVWMEKLTAQGTVKPGRALERTGAIVSGRNGRFVTDGPFAESKEAIGGYLLVDVDTLAEAVAIAQTIPGLACGGSIEVRPLAEECPLDVRARELVREEQLATV